MPILHGRQHLCIITLIIPGILTITQTGHILTGQAAITITPNVFIPITTTVVDKEVIIPTMLIEEGIVNLITEAVDAALPDTEVGLVAQGQAAAADLVARDQAVVAVVAVRTLAEEEDKPNML